MIRNIGLFLFATFVAFVFLLSGLIINLLQALLYITIYKWNRSLYRKLNYYLIYTTWAQILGMCEWWSNTHCNLWGDEEALQSFGKEHCMIVMNHRYDMDWLMCWFICDKLGMLAGGKTLAKKSLRNIPIIGWGWVFAEMIFLERNWEKDKVILKEGLSNLVEYEDPIMILYFCEGTRFTPEKHMASMEFAKARSLPQLKYHLCPRTSGFNFAVTHLKDKVAAVYDVQLGFPETPIKPTFSNMLRGYGFSGDIHITRYPMNEIPTDTDEATSKFLHQVYQNKDQLTDDYLKTNRFPGRCVQLERSYRSLLNSMFWMLVVGVPFLYLIFRLLTMGDFWVTSITVSIIVLLFSSMYILIRATKASKGSSYGKDKSSLLKTSNGAGIHDISSLQTKDLQNSQKGDGIKNLNHERDVQEKVIRKNSEGDIHERVISKDNYQHVEEQVTNNQNYEENLLSERSINHESHEDLQLHVISDENHNADVQEQVISKENDEDLQHQVTNSKNHIEDVKVHNTNEENLKIGEIISNSNLKEDVTSKEVH